MRKSFIVLISVFFLMSCSDEADLLLTIEEEVIMMNNEKEIYTNEFICPIETNAEPLLGFKAFINDINRRNRLKSATGFPSKKVFISFFVDKNGKLSSFEIIRGLSDIYDKEALKLIKSSTYEWKPGKVRNRTVDVRIVIPVYF